MGKSERSGIVSDWGIRAYIIPSIFKLMELFLGKTLDMFCPRSQRTEQEKMDLKEEDSWVCIKGIPLLLANKAWEGAGRIYT